MKLLPIVVLVSVACGTSKPGGGGGGGNGPDARAFEDAPPSVPAMITIGGTAKDNGMSSSMPLSGVAITLKNRADDATIASTTSDAQGRYAMAVATNGHVVDAYILATKSGYTDAAAFPAAPFAADTSTADSNLVTTSNFNLLALYTGQQATNGIIIAEILDASHMPVSGAAVACTPAAGSYLYSGSNGVPASGSATNSDGVGFMVNVPPGAVSISATKSGSTFKSHTVTAKANTFTSTIITE